MLQTTIELFFLCLVLSIRRHLWSFLFKQELDGRIIGVNPADSGGSGGGLARRGGRGGFGRGGYNFVR